MTVKINSWASGPDYNKAMNNPVKFLQDNYQLTADAANNLLNATKVNPLCTSPILGILACTDGIDGSTDLNITDQNIIDFMKQYNETDSIPGINNISV